MKKNIPVTLFIVLVLLLSACERTTATEPANGGTGDASGRSAEIASVTSSALVTLDSVTL